MCVRKCFLHLWICSGGKTVSLCAFSQDLLKQSEKEASVVGSLLRRAQEIRLGPQNQTLLQERARTLSQQLDRAQDQLKKE